MSIEPIHCEECGVSSRRLTMHRAPGDDRVLCYPCSRKVDGHPIQKPAHPGEQRSDG